MSDKHKDAQGELPELPQSFTSTRCMDSTICPTYTGNQMEAYARAALARRASQVSAAAPALTKDAIREVFMAHGFTIKIGETDLKQYVFDAANALLTRASEGQAQTNSAKEIESLPEYARTVVGQRVYSLGYSRGRKKGREDAAQLADSTAPGVPVEDARSLKQAPDLGQGEASTRLWLQAHGYGNVTPLHALIDLSARVAKFTAAPTAQQSLTAGLYGYMFWDPLHPDGEASAFMVQGSEDPATGKQDYQGHVWKSLPLYSAPLMPQVQPSEALGWISVTDRLPNVGVEVLVYCGYRVCGSRTDDINDPENHNGWVVDYDNGMASPITHWAPLLNHPEQQPVTPSGALGDSNGGVA